MFSTREALFCRLRHVLAASRAERGMTLVEVVVSIAIISVLLVSAVNTVTAVKEGGIWLSDFERGRTLAQEILAEAQQASYSEPSGVAAALGIDIDDGSTGHRTRFDDVDDFNGLLESPPKTALGVALSKLAGWRREVRVSWVSANDLDTAVGFETGLKRVTIDVSKNDRLITSLTMLRSSGLPPLRACCLLDGSCRELSTTDCTALSGVAGRADEHCWTVECSDGKVAQWKLDDSILSSTAKDSVAAHNGDLSGNPIWTTGQVGGALQLDGNDDFVRIEHDSTLTQTGNFTLCGWLRLNTTGGYDMIVYKGDSSKPSNYWLGAYGSAITAGFNDGNSELEFRTTSTTLIKKTKWTHLAVVFNDNADTLAIYQDGVLVQQWSTTARPTSNSERVYLGRSRSGEYLDGRLDDVRIYSRIVQPSEWAKIMTGEK